MVTFITAFFALITAPTQLSDTSSGPLKVIVDMHATKTCSTLRASLGPAIGGLLINDKLVEQGQVLMQSVRHDALVSPVSFAPIGGASGSEVLDDARMERLVSVFVKNLAIIDTLLSDPHRYPANPKDDAQRKVVSAREYLQRIEAQQRAELNVLSSVVASNQANDLNARRNPIGDQTPPKTGVPVRMSFPAALSAAKKQTQAVESTASQVMKPLVALCR